MLRKPISRDKLNITCEKMKKQGLEKITYCVNSQCFFYSNTAYRWEKQETITNYG